jgi:hypothetical protein
MRVPDWRRWGEATVMEYVISLPPYLAAIAQQQQQEQQQEPAPQVKMLSGKKTHDGPCVSEAPT